MRQWTLQLAIGDDESPPFAPILLTFVECPNVVINETGVPTILRDASRPPHLIVERKI